MKIKCIAFLLIIIIFYSSTSLAQSWMWGKQGICGLKTDVGSNSLAENKAGNVYQTGFYSNSISFGTTTLTSFSQGDLFLVKYDQNGNVLWAKTSSSDSDNAVYGYSVATDDSDNSYATGFASTSKGYSDAIALGQDTLHVPPIGQLFLVKYDANGNVIWATQPDTTIIASGTAGYAVATDKAGHEYVTGVGDFLIKYDRNGNIIWTITPTYHNEQLGVTIQNAGTSVATDIFGNIYLAGLFQDSLKFGAYPLYSRNWERFIVKFDSNGNVLWAQQFVNNRPGFIGSEAVAADKYGAAYFTGTFTDTLKVSSYMYVSPNDTTLNFFIIKFNPSGTIAWANEDVPINGSSWSCQAICTDDSSHIYISGEAVLPYELSSYDVAFKFDNYIINIIDSLSNEYTPVYLLKLDSSGNVICGSTLPSGGLGSTNVASDSTGEYIYLGGIFRDPLVIGNDSLTDNTGVTDPYVGRWIPCSGSAGINQLSANNLQLSVYPNPTNGEIIVNISPGTNDVNKMNLKVIDELGRIIYSLPSLNYTNEIDLSHLPAAIYFISVATNVGRMVVPVVKMAK